MFFLEGGIEKWSSGQLTLMSQCKQHLPPLQLHLDIVLTLSCLSRVWPTAPQGLRFDFFCLRFTILAVLDCGPCGVWTHNLTKAFFFIFGPILVVFVFLSHEQWAQKRANSTVKYAKPLHCRKYFVAIKKEYFVLLNHTHEHFEAKRKNIHSLKD